MPQTFQSILPEKLKIGYQPSEKNRQKYSLKECVIDNSALKIQCHIIKNTLLQTAFSAILPTAKYLLIGGKLHFGINISDKKSWLNAHLIAIIVNVNIRSYPSS